MVLFDRYRLLQFYSICSNFVVVVLLFICVPFVNKICLNALVIYSNWPWTVPW